MEGTEPMEIAPDAEQRLAALLAEHEAVVAELTSTKGVVVSMTQELQQAKEQLVSAERKVAEHAAEARQKDALLEQVSSASEELQDRLRRRGEECDRLREELKFQSTELVNLQHRLNDAQIAQSALQSQTAPLSFEVGKFQREKEYLEKELRALQQDFDKKCDEERKLRSETSQRIFSLETQNEQLRIELDEKTRQAALFRDQLTTQQDRADELMKKAQQQEAVIISHEADTRTQLRALKENADHYKTAFEAALAHAETLENTLSSLRETHTQKLTQQKEILQKTVADMEESFAQERAPLMQRLSELEELVKNNPVVLMESAVSAESAQSASKMEDFAGFTATEMFEKVVSLEKAVFTERARRTEIELSLNQVLKEIDVQAPVIAKQRRDFQRIVQSHNELTARLDVTLAQAAQQEKSLREVERRAEEAERERALLNAHNKDLAAQVQHLLRQREREEHGQGERAVALIEDAPETEREMSAQGVISSRLVVFNDVAELQRKNEELLLVVRKLTEEREVEKDRETEREGDAESAALLQTAMDELNALREQRRQSEEMIAVLVQQRDMYRSLHEGEREQENAMDVSENNLMSVSANALQTPLKIANHAHNAPQTPFSPAQSLSLQTRIAELQGKLEMSEDERRRERERLQRFEEAERVWREASERAREETTTLRLSLAKSEAEARFQSERASRLEAAQTLATQERETAMKRRLDLEKTLMELQRDLRAKDDALAQDREALRRVRETCSRAEVELEVTRQSEARLMQQLQDARESEKRATTLAQSLSRIEAGLQSRAEEEREALLSERETLKKNYDTLKRQVEEKRAVEEQKTKALDDELRALRIKLDAKTSEVSSVQEQLLREQGVSSTLREKATLLERQLQLSQDKLQILQGQGLTETLIEKELREKDAALQRITAERDSLQERLQSAESHATQFQSLSRANEEALKELRARSQQQETQSAQELEALRAELERVKTEFQEKRMSSQTLLQDVETARDELRKFQAQHDEQVRALETAHALLQTQHGSLQRERDALTQQVTVWEKRAQEHFEQFERELQLHAQAAAQIKEERQRGDALQRSLNERDALLREKDNEKLSLTQRLAEQEASFAAERAREKEEKDSLMRTNDLLHAQVQSIGLQLEKAHEQKLAAALAVSSSSAAAAVDAGANADNAAAAPFTSTGADEFDELQELRKSQSETREVLRFMKKEKELLSARLAIAESESERLVAQVQSLSKSLDEARAASSAAASAATAVSSSAAASASVHDYEKLLNDVQQLHLLRESNAHLRSESEELARRVQTLTAELAQEKNALVPLQEQLRSVSAERDALRAAQEQLQSDVAYWRSRLHTLVSRYNDVDPEEHRQVKEKLAQAEEREKTLLENEKKLQENVKALQESEKKLQESEKKLQETVAQKERQLATAEESAEGLRKRLRMFKTTLESKAEELKNKEKELADAQLKQTTLSTQLQEVTSKLEEKEKEIINKDKALAAAASAAAATPAVPVAASAASEKKGPAQTKAARLAAAKAAAEAAAAEKVAASAPTAAPVPGAVTPAAGAPPLPPGPPPVAALTAINATAATAVAAGKIETPAPSSEPPVLSTPLEVPADKASLLKKALLGRQKRERAAPVPVSSAVPSPSSVAASAAGTEGEEAPAAKKKKKEEKKEEEVVTVEPTEAALPVAPAVAVTAPVSVPVSESAAETPQLPLTIAPVPSQGSTVGVTLPALEVSATPSLEEGEEAPTATVSVAAPVTAPTPSASAPVMAATNPFAMKKTSIPPITTAAPVTGSVFGSLLSAAAPSAVIPASSTTPSFLFGATSSAKTTGTGFTGFATTGASGFGSFGGPTTTAAPGFGFGSALVGGKTLFGMPVKTPAASAAPVPAPSTTSSLSNMNPKERLAWRTERFNQQSQQKAPKTSMKPIKEEIFVGYEEDETEETTSLSNMDPKERLALRTERFSLQSQQQAPKTSMEPIKEEPLVGHEEIEETEMSEE